MLDALINMGRVFDWITPTLAFAQDFLRGPISDFGIPADSGWGRRDIKRLLNDYDVQVWGLMYNFSGETLLFTVRKEQAELTYLLLQRAGVPVLYAPIDPMAVESEEALAALYAYSDEYSLAIPDNIDTDY